MSCSLTFSSCDPLRLCRMAFDTILVDRAHHEKRLVMTSLSKATPLFAV
ncbi:hypothetical protein ACVWXO_004972 [Bradyrhizobium sp. LM2.7]